MTACGVKDGFDVASVADSELLQRLRRTAIPFRQRNVALVLHVLPAHGAREEAGGGEVAKAAKECRPMTHCRARALGPGDLVEHLSALRVGCLEKCLPEAAATLVVQPREPTAHRRLAPRRRIIVGEEIVH